ncbi:MAG: HD domain-containing protein [Actinobacteria bacterium]|nr:HD domain-containing protein [Actinomycetota bacterium]
MTPRAGHLARRFFAVLTAGPLQPGEQAEVARWLRPAERPLFWSQPPADQRHGLDGARAVLARRPERPDLVRAALLHDVGKRHSSLGTLRRTLVTVAAALGLPLRGRFAAYRDHGPIGAGDLAEAGAEALVVEFARHHHAARPAGIPRDDWEVLQRADHERKPPRPPRPPIP